MWSRSRSPLRYPGSKARFAKFIAQAIRLNGLRGAVFVEPFCGGASVSIALMEEAVVSEIALNDADPAIAAFWDIVFSPVHAKWLADQVLTIPLTLTEWDRQKRLSPATTREAALRCLYLNRTSFNGVLQARGGPVGGRSQKNRTLGARFNREVLAKRILELSAHAHRVIAVDGNHWHPFLSRLKGAKNAVFYLDPPFYHKADRLYDYCFDESEHRQLRDTLRRFSAPWLLSYDDAPEVRALYEGLDVRARMIDSTYSTHPVGGGSFIGRELLYTKLRRLPAPGPADAEHEGLRVLNGNGKSKGDGPVRRPYSVVAPPPAALISETPL
jgi:DNA adenine methylase